ncbi:MAG: hypothetical protein A3K65_08870 [Euryarchaeota archaeon RBG_16_68_12]|nr:MAG: hypothetical protein A3K65_08870 [Euryarchaeota archaeon RBG_16_68_12]
MFRNVNADTTSVPGMMMSPRPMNIASRSSPFAICSLMLPCSRYEYDAFFGMTRRIGSFWVVISSARVTICFDRYTAQASYSARRMRRRNAGRIAKEIPRIAVTPAATAIPTPSTTYHSGNRCRAYAMRAAMTNARRVARFPRKTSSIGIRSSPR